MSEIEHDEHGFGKINQGYAGRAADGIVTSRMAARTTPEADEWINLGQSAKALRAVLTEHAQGQVHVRFANDLWEVTIQRPNEQVTGHAAEFVDAIDDAVTKVVDMAREGD